MLISIARCSMHAGDVFGTRRSFNCTQLVFQLLPDDRRERLPLWRLHVAIIDVFALQLCGSDGENGNSLLQMVVSLRSQRYAVCAASQSESAKSRGTITRHPRQGR